VQQQPSDLPGGAKGAMLGGGCLQAHAPMVTAVNDEEEFSTEEQQHYSRGDRWWLL
jgi:hypothetical protein